MKKHLDNCPSCNATIEITRYTCPDCCTSIEGHFTGCNFCKLGDDDRLFALIFLQTEGNMKDVERLLGISYPTVKARLAKLNAAISQDVEGIQRAANITQPPSENVRKNPGIAARILDRLQSGEITPEEAAAFIRGQATIEGKDD